MTRGARAKLGQSMGKHMGRTLFELYHDAEFQTQNHKFRVSGPGLDALKEAQATDKGAIIVSGHFGQWEAIRAVLSENGANCFPLAEVARNNDRPFAGCVRLF